MEEENKGGRPTEYETRLNKLVYKLCLLGATDKEIADILEVSEQTLNTWKRVHPKFLESMLKGKDKADAEIADALFKRAKGFKHKEDKIFVHEGKPVIVPTIKQYPPDTQAAFIWLKNRRSGTWRDKQEIDHTSKGEQMQAFDYSKLPDDVLKKIADIQESHAATDNGEGGKD